MLVRVVVKNLFSFKDQTELNFLPGKATRLKKHKYSKGNIEVLKLSAIYGANGSGKSNLIKSLSLLKELVIDGVIPSALKNNKFKLSKQSILDPVELGIEFFCNEILYYYTVTIHKGVIIDEYFCSVEQNSKEDRLIFHRSLKEGKISLEFYEEFGKSPENEVLKNVIFKDLQKPSFCLLNLLNGISNDGFKEIKDVYEWFDNKLIILYPTTEPENLPLFLDKEQDLKEFANSMICSFNTGISSLKIDKVELKDFLGKDNQKSIDEITNELTIDPEKIAKVSLEGTKERIFVINDEGRFVTKRIVFEHMGENDESVDFKIGEESDGTVRLLEYIPAFNHILKSEVTYIIDEIERSIHPLMIKELISKFSMDETTKGQLIFTTHESNLLDQEILRTDEIWFAQKNPHGATQLYSLSDFKEHNTIDIRKGYLSGRYGGIPFLSNLHDLNWNLDAFEG